MCMIQPRTKENSLTIFNPLDDWLDKVEREKQKAAQEAARLLQEAIDEANKLAQSQTSTD